MYGTELDAIVVNIQILLEKCEIEQKTNNYIGPELPGKNNNHHNQNLIRQTIMKYMKHCHDAKIRLMNSDLNLVEDLPF